jgi:putative membrane protein
MSEEKKITNVFLRNRLVSHKKMAQERTVLASERNLLAYIRTGLASFGIGIALIKLFEEHIKYVYAGYIALTIGLCFIFFGIFSHPIRKKKILEM